MEPTRPFRDAWPRRENRAPGTGAESRKAETLATKRCSPEVAIRAVGLCKLYRIGETPEKYKMLRDTIARIATAPLRRLRSAREARSNADNTIWALRDVSFEIRRGEVVGVIGRNGAGKSTLLKVLSRITEPTEGQAEIHGRVGSLLEVGTGFHNELTGRENVLLNGAILGMRRAEIQAKFDEIVAFAEIEKFIDTTVKHYSSGMYMRLAFAVAAFLEPEVLLIDEVLAVGDVMFQKKCIGKMEDVARAGRTVLFVSHNMGAVRSLCTTGILLEEGRVAYAGSIGPCVEAYFTQVGAFHSTAAVSAREGMSPVGFGPVLVRGSRNSTVLQSEPFELETSLGIRQEAGGFSVSCTVNDMHDRVVFQLKEQSSALNIGSVLPGVYAIRVTLPPLWLNPGLYSVFFTAFILGTDQSAAQRSDKVPLDVTGAHGASGAPLHPAATWSASRVGPTEPAAATDLPGPDAAGVRHGGAAGLKKAGDA
jgi:lipopolysaccharide transport system ATP-binding protein